MALAGAALLIAVAAGAREVYAAPPLLLVGALMAVVTNVMWGGLAAVLCGSLVGLTSPGVGWGALGYLVGAALVIVVLTDRLVLELRQRDADARRGLGLLSVLLAGLRRVARTSPGGDVDATLPGVLEGADSEGFAVWRIVGGIPEPVAGSVDAFTDARTADAVRGAVGERATVARDLGAGAGARHLEVFPVLERGDVAAVVTSSQPHALRPPERAVVQEFAGTLGNLMQHVDEEHTGRLVLELVEHHGPGRGTAAMSRALLDLAVPEVGVLGGAVMRYRSGRFAAEAATDSLPPSLRNRLVEGIRYGQGVIWKARESGEHVFIGDYGRVAGSARDLVMLGVASLALVPVGGPGASHVGVLVHDAPRAWAARERVLLVRLAQVLGASVRQRVVESRVEEMARLQRELLSTRPEAMYRRLLDAALRLVPGAEAASLLVRGGDGAFRYVATVGYALEALLQVRWTDDDMRTWYAEDLRGWREGEPRVFVSGDRSSVADISALTMPGEDLLRASRVGDIVANLCLPVVYGGEVLAVLNLDALSDPNAFTAASIEAASGLAPFVGFLLQESDLRAKLEAAARSDALTGLANRRSFNEQAPREMARAVRHGEALALLVLDLQAFKELNDACGHDEGDRALVAVADALRRTVRAGDSVYRWGGDEFAALLPHANAASARVVARRIAAAVGEIVTSAGRVAVNIGVACVPDDGEAVGPLMQAADERMYAAKARRQAVVDGDAAVGGSG
ncbi:MAG TPA: sensor domain-containing diguanylate cyclase [Trueperaceae bacterium]|nr:sensor domain-containing diguanylate cyclase [Trueperaceae bacterium]